MGAALSTAFPFSPLIQTGLTAYATFTIDASNEVIEIIFQADEDATITRLGVNVSAVTTPPTMRISLQSVNASTGRASGTVLGATNNALKTFTPAAGWTWHTLDETVSVTRGGYYAWVVEYSSGTIGASNLSTYNYAYTNQGQLPDFPLAWTAPGGVGSRTANAIPCWGYGSASKAYGLPSSSVGTITLDSATTPDEVGVVFTVPGASGTMTVRGARVFHTSGASGRTLLMSLYTGTTSLQSVTLDTDIQGAPGVKRMRDMIFDESSLTALTMGSQYRLSFTPNDTSADIVLQYIDVSSNDDLAAWPGGTGFYMAGRTDAGAWSDTTTRRLISVELIIDDITGSGAGGLMTHPGMSGGMRG